MLLPLCRAHRLIVFAVTAWSWAAGSASAQALDQRLTTTPSLAAVKARVPIGDVVYVTDTTNTTIRGTLAELTDETMAVKIKDDLRSVSATEVRRIQWQQPDSPLAGVLIGAAAGAIPGIYWLAADPNECSGMCPEEYALIGIGAVVGGLIDHAITRRVTVYTAGTSSGRAKTVTIGPLVRRNRNGVQIALKF